MDPADARKLEELLQDLWRNNKSILLERAEWVRCAQRRMAKDKLDAETRERAREAAHKLAGVLGTFGLMRGTELARQAEILLDGHARIGAAEAAPLAAIVDELEAMIAARSAEVS